MCVGETRDNGARIKNGSVDLHAEHDIGVATEQRANTRDLEEVKNEVKCQAYLSAVLRELELLTRALIFVHAEPTHLPNRRTQLKRNLI